MQRHEQPETILKITGELTVHTAAEWHRALCSGLQAEHPIVINLSEVTAADTNGIQLLVSAWQTATARSPQFSLSNPSDAILEAAHAASLSLPSLTVASNENDTDR